MRNLEKRLAKLEERHAAEAAEFQKLLARMEAGRERARRMHEQRAHLRAVRDKAIAETGRLPEVWE